MSELGLEASHSGVGWRRGRPLAEARHGRPGRPGRGVGSDRPIRPSLPRSAGRAQPLNIEYVSFRENLDTGGPLGRAVVIIIGAIAELERNLIVERVRAGMRRARLEGRHICRRPVDVDRVAVLRERDRGQSLSQIATTYRVSRATVSRIIKLAQQSLATSL